VAALLDAAGRQLADRGVAGVSVRSVAAAAGVNHGLVHRHFGSKDALVGAVLDDLAARIADHAAADPDWPLGTPDDEVLDRFWRVLARSILDGDAAAQQRHHPTMAALVARLRARGLDDGAARLAAAQAAAATLGWLLFEPFLEAATGLDPTAREANRAAMRAAVDRLLPLPPPTPD
jgi:AcrR family transcriptional regulator